MAYKMEKRKKKIMKLANKKLKFLLAGITSILATTFVFTIGLICGYLIANS